MEVGTRVVRGPDWKWGNQDDGEGHVGTVVEIGRAGSSNTPEKTVVVQWDSGSRTNYRTGYQGSFDLRVYDNAPVGVRHPNISCNSCQKHGIPGIRWKCATCPNYDLCSPCYMADKHDLQHPFLRFDSANAPGVEVPKRSSKSSVKLVAKGIFNGARVQRGFDWDWDNQDGGEGKVGQVIDVRGWDNESRRSVANVLWSSGSTNVYRLGHKGKVDLKYTVESEGGKYYRDHLPILGQIPTASSSVTSSSSSAVTLKSAHASQTSMPAAATSSSALAASGGAPPPMFLVGDKVKVNVTEEELKALQEGHGGWNPRMAAFIGKIGTVHRITDHGDIRVQFDGCVNRWTFNPRTLIGIPNIMIGDMVRVMNDVNEMKKLQKSHGEWIDQMLAIMDKVGRVSKIYGDGDLRVTFDIPSPNTTWTLNPLCVTIVTRANNGSSPADSQPPRSSSRSRHRLGTDPATVAEDDIMNSLSPRLGHLALSESQQEVVNQAIHSPLPSVTSSNQPIPGSSPPSSSANESRRESSITAAKEHKSRASSGGKGDKKNHSSNSANTAVIGSPSTSSKLNSSKTGIVEIDLEERVKFLESRIAEFEETYSCGICMERVRNVVFPCGHGACVVCAQTLYTCHMCRKLIERKINLY